MQLQTLYLDRIKDDSGKINWISESFNQLKRVMRHLPEGKFKVFIQEVKRIGGWRYKYYWGHVLPLIVEYMNRNSINQILDPSTGELIPIDVESLHEYHKQVFNPGLIKNLLKKKDGKGNIPEFIVVPLSTTKMTDGEFINRFEEEIIATYANEYGIDFIPREDFKIYFQDDKNSKMIIDLQMGHMDDVEMEVKRLNSFKEEEV